MQNGFCCSILSALLESKCFRALCPKFRALCPKFRAYFFNFSSLFSKFNVPILCWLQILV